MNFVIKDSWLSVWATVKAQNITRGFDFFKMPCLGTLLLLSYNKKDADAAIN